MNAIQLDPKWLKAASVCSGVKDIRYYLNGVLVDIRERETRIVSTDGHRLICLRRAVPSNEPDQVSAQVIIPGDVIKGIKANKKGNKCILQYEMIEEQMQCKLVGLETCDVSFVAIDGKFPDYERVFPLTEPTMEYSHFCLKYLADMTKAAQIASGYDRVEAEVWPSGNGAASVTFGPMPEFFGVVMPMRGSDKFALPEWLGTVKPVAKLKQVA